MLQNIDFLSTYASWSRKIVRIDWPLRHARVLVWRAAQRHRKKLISLSISALKLLSNSSTFQRPQMKGSTFSKEAFSKLDLILLNAGLRNPTKIDADSANPDHRLGDLCLDGQCPPAMITNRSLHCLELGSILLPANMNKSYEIARNGRRLNGSWKAAWSGTGSLFCGANGWRLFMSRCAFNHEWGGWTATWSRLPN